LSLYQCDPQSGNKAVEWPQSYFPESQWINENEALALRQTVDGKSNVKLKLLAIDPSKGTTAKAGDYQAITLCEYLNSGQIIVRSWVNRMTVEGMLDTILQLWQSEQPDAITIETGAGQETYTIRLLDKAKYVSTRPLPLYPFENRVQKEVRIRMGLSPYLAQHKFKFLRMTGNSILVNQARVFPTGDYDDAIDSLEMNIQLHNYLSTGNRVSKGVLLRV